MEPFRDAAMPLYEAGWHPIPLPPGAKAPPPSGYTGAGPDADVDTITDWIAHGGHFNVGVRLDTTVVGIDVDDYDDHGGGATLAALIAQHGPLPPTYSSTSRGPGTSRIYYYRIPSGLIFPGNLGPGVDVIQHHHRYAVVSPSQHPDGPTYEWYDGRDTMMTTCPAVDALPPLPVQWHEARLRAHETADRPPTIPQMLHTANGPSDDSIADAIAHMYRWHDVLTADGWNMARAGADTSWTRPGKTRGISAVLHEPDGPLVVFSTGVPALQHPWALTRDGNAWAFGMFGYIAATRYGGDRSACARDYRQQANAAAWVTSSATVAAVALDTEVAADDDDPWARFHVADLAGEWVRPDVDTDEWLAYPLVPARRAIALHAPAKEGKSIVTLAAVAAMALGRPLFGRYPMARPVTVGYLDYEMSDLDLYDRLEELGYTPADGLAEHLHYAVLPDLAGLDTPMGGATVVAWAQHIGADLIVLDTFGRAVHGPENDADTVRNFYRSTGQLLKNAGIASWRLDHTGKDRDRGQRGSSSKNEDVDMVWRLTRTDEGAVLDATHARTSTTRTITLARVDEGAGLVTWRCTDVPAVLDSTIEMARAIDRAGIGVDMSINAALRAYRAMGHTAKTGTFYAAQKLRMERVQRREEVPDEKVPSEFAGKLEEVPSSRGNSPGIPGNTPPFAPLFPGTTHTKGWWGGREKEKGLDDDGPPIFDY